MKVNSPEFWEGVAKSYITLKDIKEGSLNTEQENEGIDNVFKFIGDIVEGAYIRAEDEE